MPRCSTLCWPPERLHLRRLQPQPVPPHILPLILREKLRQLHLRKQDQVSPMLRGLPHPFDALIQVGLHAPLIFHLRQRDTHPSSLAFCALSYHIPSPTARLPPLQIPVFCYNSTIYPQGQACLSARLSGAFCPFRLGGRAPACGSKANDPSNIHRRQVQSSFAGAEMCPNKKRPAGNTHVLPRDLTQCGRISARQNRVCPCR